jgi:hypothetical protein
MKIIKITPKIPKFTPKIVDFLTIRSVWCRWDFTRHAAHFTLTRRDVQPMQQRGGV